MVVTKARIIVDLHDREDALRNVLKRSLTFMKPRWLKIAVVRGVHRAAILVCLVVIAEAALTSLSITSSTDVPIEVCVPLNTLCILVITGPHFSEINWW